MYKVNTKYKLIGYQPVGFKYNVYREEIAEWKNGSWCPWGSSKRIVNFVVEKIEEIN